MHGETVKLILIWSFAKITLIVTRVWAWDSVVVKALRNSRTVPGKIPGGVTGDFFRGSP